MFSFVFTCLESTSVIFKFKVDSYGRRTQKNNCLTSKTTVLTSTRWIIIINLFSFDPPCDVTGTVIRPSPPC